MNAEPMIKGWCPGALRPMRSGDGLIVRLKIGGGIVGIRLAALIAGWSRRWGNGQIELTSRGRLQLRGIREECLPDLHAAMAEWELLDADPGGEAVRNVISSPLAGLDPSAVLDIRPIARELEQLLTLDQALHELPGKFGFAIDDGGALGLDDVAADIRFVAGVGLDGPAFSIGLDGAPAVRFGPCFAHAVVEVAVSLSKMFLNFRRGRESRIRRMRDMVAERGAEAIGRAAGLVRLRADLTMPEVVLRGCSPVVILGLDPRIYRDTHEANSKSADATANVPVVPSAPDARSPVFVGAGLPFGAIEADDLAEFVVTAGLAGATELRLTPWRAILVPVTTIEAGRTMVAHLTAGGFVVSAADPHRRIAACSGAPACARASTPVRRDAALLAATIARMPGEGITLHVSGCEKGCAHPTNAPITLVARDGRYDMVLNGKSSDTPVSRGLNPVQIGDQVKRLVTVPSPAAAA
jgi:precorrin-3B synthase